MDCYITSVCAIINQGSKLESVSIQPSGTPIAYATEVTNPQIERFLTNLSTRVADKRNRAKTTHLGCKYLLEDWLLSWPRFGLRLSQDGGPLMRLCELVICDRLHRGLSKWKHRAGVPMTTVAKLLIGWLSSQPMCWIAANGSEQARIDCWLLF